MKNAIMIIVAMVCMSSYAQDSKNEKREHRKEMREKMANLTPEQMAELSTKKMTLHLDLNESQQTAVQKMELEKAKKRKAYKENRKEGTKPTDEERFKMKSQMLDEQIAAKKQMKAVLTPEQYTKWEKMHSKKRGMRSHHKKREGSKDKS